MITPEVMTSTTARTEFVFFAETDSFGETTLEDLGVYREKGWTFDSLRLSLSPNSSTVFTHRRRVPGV